MKLWNLKIGPSSTRGAKKSLLFWARNKCICILCFYRRWAQLRKIKKWRTFLRRRNLHTCSSRMTYLYSTRVPAGSSISQTHVSPGVQLMGTLAMDKKDQPRGSYGVRFVIQFQSLWNVRILRGWLGSIYACVCMGRADHVHCSYNEGYMMQYKERKGGGERRGKDLWWWDVCTSCSYLAPSHT